MQCSRCGGLIISDRYLGLDGQLPMLRCANCGAILDASIQRHQRDRQCTEVQRSRARHRFPELSRMTRLLLHNE
ncbi:hypothetical protein [Nitrospira sp. Nam74]